MTNDRNHIHRWIDDDGVTEVTISAEDHDRRWLQSQRLLETGPAVVYAGYTPISRRNISFAGGDTPQLGGVRYGGYMFEDVSGCPICQGER